MMQVEQVATDIWEPCSGYSRSLPAISEALARQGANVRLHVQRPAQPSHREFRQVTLCQYRPWPVPPRVLAVSPEMRRGLEASARSSDIVHSHVIWQMPAFYAARAARKAKRPIIHSPSGALSEWALNKSRQRKDLMWMLAQGRTFRQTACFHATCVEEYEDIRRAGLKGAVAIIPLGVEVPEQISSGMTPEGRRRLIFVSRVHPKKGIDTLIRSWRTLQDEFPEWELMVVGGDPDSPGYLAQMEELTRVLGAQRVIFRGRVSEEDRAEALRHASLFVLPTHSENFGLVVPEALAAGVPAIVSKGAPWEGLEQQGCGWWIDLGEGPLTECLRTAMAKAPDELLQMGNRGREWAVREFSWDVVARRLLEMYQWVLGRGNPPGWVRT